FFPSSASSPNNLAKSPGDAADVVGSVPVSSTFRNTSAASQLTPSSSTSWPNTTFSGTTRMPYRRIMSGARSLVLSVTSTKLSMPDVAAPFDGVGNLLSKSCTEAVRFRNDICPVPANRVPAAFRRPASKKPFCVPDVRRRAKRFSPSIAARRRGGRRRVVDGDLLGHGVADDADDHLQHLVDVVLGLLEFPDDRVAVQLLFQLRDFALDFLDHLIVFEILEPDDF